MKVSDLHRIPRPSDLEAMIRQGTPEEAAQGAARLLALEVKALPAAVRATPIELVRWSQTFATNGRWKQIWRRLGVSTLADLGRVGRALAETRGVGRAKLLVLIRDL